MADKSEDTTLKDEMELLMEQAELCQSLTHHFRLKILRLLSSGKKNVTQLMEETQKPQPYISQHLRVLRDKKAVNTDREGNEVYYSLADPKIEKICQLVAELIKTKNSI